MNTNTHESGKTGSDSGSPFTVHGRKNRQPGTVNRERLPFLFVSIRVHSWFSLFFPVILLLSGACAGFHEDEKNAFEKEMHSVSNVMETKEIREHEKEIAELKKRHKESMMNLRLLEEATTLIRNGAERLKSQFDSLRDRVPEPSPETPEETNIISLKKEITQIENDLKQFQGRTE